jgi:energy-coupling factor transport system permease protein
MTRTFEGRTATADQWRWRTRDIVVTAVIGVAFGVVFFMFQAVWGALAGLGPLQNVFYGVWLLPAVLAPLIVRKPGAALFAELVAAGLSMMMGSIWSLDVLLSGFLQGGAAEIVFAVTRYRSWSWPVLAVASLASALAAFVHDWLIYYAAFSLDVVLLIGLFMAVSAVILMPLAATLLARALREAGVLEGFPA